MQFTAHKKTAVFLLSSEIGSFYFNIDFTAQR